jgi:predicted transcriptional regulator
MTQEDLADDGCPDPRQIADRQDFASSLTILKEQAGLTVREIARAAGLPTATAGDYFSGRHLPQVKLVGMFTRMLAACGVIDPEAIRQWHVALRRVRRAAPR